MTDQEALIVQLIGEGYVRWKIAQLVGMRETDVREIIRDLCKRYDRPMADLPAAVERLGKDL